MKTLLVLTLLAIATTPAAHADHRDDLANAAHSLERNASQMQGDYKNYLKAIRHWEPRGSEERLWDLMKRLKESADDLHDRAKNKYDDKTRRLLDIVLANGREVGRYIGLARSRRVHEEWRDCEVLLNRLQRLRGYSSRGSYDRDDYPRRDNDRRPVTRRPFKFW